MIYPEGDILKERVRNRYSLVVLASKRAKQIKEGAPVLIDTASTNFLTIALEEIAAGKVSYSEHLESAEDDESPAGLAPAMEFGAPDADFEQQEAIAPLLESDTLQGSGLEENQEEPDQTGSGSGQGQEQLPHDQTGMEATEDGAGQAAGSAEED